MASQTEGFHTFNVEWFDSQAALVRPFQLRFYPYDGQVEMFDVKSRRIFLKKCHYPSISIKDLYPGAQISIFSRTLTVTDYGDSLTRSALASQKDPVLIISKPCSLPEYTDIFAAIQDAGLTVSHAKLCELTPSHTQAILAPSTFVGPALVIQALGPQSVISLNNIIARASSSSPLTRLYVSPSSIDAAKQSSVIFPSSTTEAKPAMPSPHTASSKAPLPAPVVLSSGVDCTVVIIKPHALSQGYTAGVLNALSQGNLTVSALCVLHLDRNAASEFLDVYRGVVPEYNGLVEHLASGPCLALELKHASSSPAPIGPHVRQLCGPHDPAIARTLRPNTIRARFGTDKVHNAVHSTDLADDGALESEFLFKIMQ